MPDTTTSDSATPSILNAPSNVSPALLVGGTLFATSLAAYFGCNRFATSFDSFIYDLLSSVECAGYCRPRRLANTPNPDVPDFDSKLTSVGRETSDDRDAFVMRNGPGRTLGESARPVPAIEAKDSQEGATDTRVSHQMSDLSGGRLDVDAQAQAAGSRKYPDASSDNNRNKHKENSQLRVSGRSNIGYYDDHTVPPGDDLRAALERKLGLVEEDLASIEKLDLSFVKTSQIAEERAGGMDEVEKGEFATFLRDRMTGFRQSNDSLRTQLESLLTTMREQLDGGSKKSDEAGSANETGAPVSSESTA